MVNRKTQADAVVEVMEINGGYAKLEYLYSEVVKIPGVDWKTSTIDASIRRIVQQNHRIIKIKPGLYALKECIEILPKDILLLTENNKNESTNQEYGILNHSYYQGMVAEIGIISKFDTHIPPKDRRKIFIDKELDEVCSLKKIPTFTYQDVVNTSKNIDVIFFNSRNYPQQVFEIEHTTDFDNSLLKFVKLRDFNIKMNVVAIKEKQKLFIKKIENPAFDAIRKRVNFIDYDNLGKIYESFVFMKKTESLSFIQK